MSKFVNPETHGGNYKEGLSFKQIVLSHLQRITQLASKELRGGYWETKVKPMGNAGVTEKYYIPDSREEYSNAVNVLADLLLPHFDEEMRNAEQDINQVLETWTEKTNDKKKESYEKWKQSYRHEKAKTRRKLLRELTKFLYRKNYLELGMLEE